MNTESSLYKELTEDERKAVIQTSLHTNLATEVTLLDGGMFNTTYRIRYGEQKREAVLRCGPVNRHLLMTFENNLMEAENFVYQICEKIGVPCSKVLACDTTKRLINRDYMIVEYIKSVPLSDKSIGQEQKAKLYAQTGSLMKKFHSVTGEKFGRISNILSGMAFDSWWDYLESEITDILEKSKPYRAFSEQEETQILYILKKHKALLNEITVPHLVHADLWEGNVLICEQSCEYNVAAIIDMDRAVFGDVDFELATGWMINEDFLKGYDPDFDYAAYRSEDRTIRRKIYGMLFYLIEAYVGIAEYNNLDQYRQNKKLILDLLPELIE